MKNCLTLLSFLLLITNIAVAQKIIFSEDFEHFGSPIISGWNTATHTGPDPWQAEEMYLVTGSSNPLCLCYNTPNELNFRKVAGITDCGGRLGINYDNSNDLMYTPPIDFTGHKKVVLRMDSYFVQRTDGLHTEKGTIEVSVDNGLTWSLAGTASANATVNEFNTYYLDLSVYNTYNNVRIGFRYNDGGGLLSGWAIDNVMVFEPVDKDIALTAITPTNNLLSYTRLNTALDHTYQVLNLGNDTIHEFTLNYQQDNSAIKTDTIKNVNIARFASQTITHHIPDTVVALNTHNVTAWVAMTGDTIHNNDTMHTFISGAYFMPQKIVALEEGTATWNAYCIPGHVFMQQLDTSHEYYACQVSVHDTDPMMTNSIQPYSEYLYNLDQNFTPYFLLDRRTFVDITQLFKEIKTRQTYFGYVDINIDPKLDDGKFTVIANIKPAIDLTGDFRAVLIVTEDDVTGEGAGYAQANAYAGGMLGPMGGYENKTDPVPASDMKYQFVARGIYPSPDGVTNLPTTMTHNQNYSVRFDAQLDGRWDINKLRANIFIIRNDDSSVINSNKILFYLGIKDNNTLLSNAYLYPNPADEQCTLQCNSSIRTNVAIQLTDISGRVITNYKPQQFNAGINTFSMDTHGLTTGLYLINIIADQGRKSLKLQVIH